MELKQGYVELGKLNRFVNVSQQQGGNSDTFSSGSTEIAVKIHLESALLFTSLIEVHLR